MALGSARKGSCGERKGSRRGREARERLTGRGQKKTVLKESEERRVKRGHFF